MVYDLKNRPRFEVGVCVDGYKRYYEETEEWFKGFERQERKRLEKARKEMERLKREEPNNRVAWNFWAGYVRAKIEILGVSSACEGCIYYNGKGGCWARKGKAEYGATGCDYRRKEKP